MSNVSLSRSFMAVDGGVSADRLNADKISATGTLNVVDTCSRVIQPLMVFTSAADGWIAFPVVSTFPEIDQTPACFQKNQPTTVKINPDSIAVTLNNP